MSGRTQAELVAEQFGPQAAAYLASAVHAEGADLVALAEMVRGHGEARVLDLGCGAGHVSFRVAPHVAEVTAYDLSPAMLELVRATALERGLANIATRNGVAEHLPFAEGSFDFVFSRYSAHHWHDMRQGVREAARVLKPGGRAAFVDVVAPASPLLDTFLQAVELLRDPSHVRDYTAAEWQAALREAGLAPEAATPSRLRLSFAEWIGRMRTPAPHVEAIRSLQQGCATQVRDHFAIEADGTFTVDVLLLTATRG